MFAMNECTSRSRSSAALPRCRWFGLAVAVALAFTGGLAAQVVRDNVNIMNPAPDSLFVGDIFERQVETDIAVSPVNSGRAMAGFIDYQTLNMPLASSWCGYSITNNGGKTWKSNLLPGFPQDTSPDGASSPIKGLIQCVDPVVAAAPPNATDRAQIYYGGMGMTKEVLNKVFVATFEDLDDGSGTLKYLRTVQIDVGNYSFQGQVLDKPAITVDPPSPSFLQGIVHFSYVVFDGKSASDFRTKVLYARSTDGGRTFSRPVKLNGTFNKNNGTAFARTPDRTVAGGATIPGKVFVFWRTYLEENGIQVVSIDRAGNVSKPVTVAGGPSFHAFDHPSSAVTFRSSAFPTAVADVNGRLFAAWQEYVNADGSPATTIPGAGPRIVVTSSLDGLIWDQRKAADMGFGNAFQFQPDLSAGGGVISLLFFDSRYDGRGLDLNGLMSGIDRRMEVRVAQATMKLDGTYGNPLFTTPSQEVSKYATYGSGQVTGQVMPRPGYTDATWTACKAGNLSRPWICDAVNLPNLKNTSDGAVAFIGDYIGLVSAVEFKRENGIWRLALQPGDYDARTFYAVWADNRLASFPGSPFNPDIYTGNWAAYVPGSNCVNPGSRNTKPFFATISPGVVARWSGTSRPLKETPTSAAVNAFTVTVENQTLSDKYFRIAIFDNKPTEDWSFVQPPAPLDSNTVDLQVLRNSAFTRSVYYRGANATPTLPVTVKVQEIGFPGGPVIDPPLGLSTSITVTISGSPIVSSSLYGLGVGTQSVSPPLGAKANKKMQPHNFGFENFGFENFGFENFGFENFGFENFGFENFGFENSPPDYDVSWTVNGQGLLPTSGNTFVNVADAQNLLSNNGYMFRLFTYLTHSSPALNFGMLTNGCPAPGQLLQDQVISSIPIAAANASRQVVGAFGFENFGFENFGFENYPPDITNGAFVADPDGVKLTLRSYRNSWHSPSVLYLPAPTNGVVSQGIVSQALNPGQNPNNRTGSFDDTTPPVIVPIITSANPPQNGWYRGAVSVSWSVSDPGSGITSQTGCGASTITAEGQTTVGPCSAVNGKGLSASNSVTIRIDWTPPSINSSRTPAPNAAGWNNTDVTVTFACSDALSGVAVPPLTPQVVSTEGVGQARTGTCSDAAGNSNSATVSPINIDKTKPIVKSITVPAEGKSYLLNANVASSFACEDTLSGMASCTGPALVPTRTLGENTFTVTATDKAGNTATRMVTYSVVYEFILTPPKSPANLGSAVPLTWRLTDANGAVVISDMGSLVSLTSIAPDGTPALLYSPAGGATGGSGFRFSSPYFQFNWDTSTASRTGQGLYTVVWVLTDGFKRQTSIELIK
jgi:hypothetical protein